MSVEDDHLWDSSRPGSDEAFDRKYEEWDKRDWLTWLGENLVFPFKATREEDEDDAYFREGAARALFRLGHTMEIMGLDEEDELRGIIVNARENGQVGEVPLCDLKVKPRTDRNYWPVREYVVWFANR